jgi:prevent-host-death family protein
MVYQVNIREAKTHLSWLVDRAAAGEEIIIAKSGRPIARLVAMDKDLSPRVFGTMRGKIRIADDFDAPLLPEILASFAAEP